MGIVVRISWLFLLLLTLQACGGGSDGGESTPPFSNQVIANAGDDQTVSEGASVTLMGEAQSDDTNLTYAWSASPALAISQSASSSGAASFTAPAVTQDRIYTIKLVVTGAAGGRDEDELIVTVVPKNLAPVAAITVPTFTNVPEGSIPAGDTIILDSTASTDADAPDTTRQIRDWQWQQTAGAQVLVGVETNQPTLTFTAPLLAESDTLSFTLTVTDAEGATDSTSTSVVVLAQNQTPPKVEAGLDKFVFSGETIVLAGSASTTVPIAEPVTVQWEGQTNVTINNATTADTYATAPLVETSTDIVMVLTAMDAFGNQVEDSFTVNVRPVPVPIMNDTGVVLQADATNILSTQQNAFPGQDGQLGQDRINENGQIEKAGRGQSGFDFTPLNDNGDEMDTLAQEWRCVRDNTTGFVWEAKLDDGSLHTANATFSWYFDANNGGFEGDQNGPDTQCNIATCNTQAYIEAVNQAGLCGFYDWRLPTHDELMSIVDFGVAGATKIDINYFPNIGDVDEGPIWYWTNQPGADGVADDAAQNAWAIDFQTGVDNFLNKSTAARVRLVRAGR